MGSCFSDMEGGKQAIRRPIHRDGHTYDDAFGLFLRPHSSADTQTRQSAHPAPSILPEEEEEEEERQMAIAIMVSLEPELEQGIIPQLSFWLSEPTTGDASTSSRPLQQDQAKVSKSLPSAPPAPNGSSGSLECEYCFDAPIGATCDPCGHVACFNCWLRIQDSDNKCPRCRVVIKKIIKLYM